MRTKVPAFVVRHHRSLLVIATLILAIAGSRAASDLASVPDWLIVVGSGGLLFAADGGREASDLARGFPLESRKKAGVDILAANSHHAVALTITSLVLMIAGTAGLAAISVLGN